MAQDSLKPLVVQSDRTVLVEVQSPAYEEVRGQLARFAELIKSPEFIHTYQITPLSVWNAVAAGVRTEDMVGTLKTYARYEIPALVIKEIQEYASRYGRIKLLKSPGEDRLILQAAERYLAEEIAHTQSIMPLLGERIDSTSFWVRSSLRGRIKVELIHAGWPAEDLVGYAVGEELKIAMREHIAASGKPFILRPYQRAGVDIFYDSGTARGGSGVIVLPCGAGKTIVGIQTMAQIGASTLVLTTSVSALRQWKAELLDKTDLDDSMIGEYSGFSKEIRPVTLTTYQILTHRSSREEDFTHFGLFDKRNWGLIIYDEVHVLPAPVFQMTSHLQAKRRLGLTATLVREDGREDEVFALIGPKKFDVPWKDLENQGWIAEAVCTEIRVPLPEGVQMEYAVADERQRFRIASENPDKLAVARRLLSRHSNSSVLIIGQYIDQLKVLSSELEAPMVSGSTPQKKRDRLYEEFRAGNVPVLVVSKVANFALDLPDAQVAIQVSGTFGSRQEEAQRLGRILRPKAGENTAFFYTLVSRDTREVEFARNRQLFLVEQGYAYEIVNSDEL